MNRKPLNVLVAILAALMVCYAAVWGSVCHAQTVVRTDTCTGQVLPVPLPPTAVLWDDIKPTLPLTCNAATEPKRAFNMAGATVWRYCKRSDGTWKPQWGAATWEQVRADPTLPGDTVAALINPTDEALQAVVGRFLNTPLDAPELKAVWCPHWAVISAGIPMPTPTPLPPSPAPWTVAGSTAFFLRNGALVAGAGVAKVGTACDCTTPFVSGLTTYCRPVGAAVDVVARCKR